MEKSLQDLENRRKMYWTIQITTPNEVSEILEKLNKFEFTYKDKESGEEDKRIRIRALREIPNNRELLIHLTKRRV